jgi:hypothetical protein
VQLVIIAPQQSLQEWHLPSGESLFELPPRESIDLDQEQARFFSRSFGLRQSKVAHRPFIPTEAASQTMEDSFDSGKHGKFKPGG